MVVRWSVCDTISCCPAGLFNLEFWGVGRDGCRAVASGCFCAAIFFSVLLAFLGADVFLPKGTSMPGFEKNLS